MRPTKQRPETNEAPSEWQETFSSWWPHHTLLASLQPSSERVKETWPKWDQTTQGGNVQMETNNETRLEVFRHCPLGGTFIPAAAAGPLGSTAWMWHGLLPRTTKPQPTASPTIWRGKPQWVIGRWSLAICLSFQEKENQPRIKVHVLTSLSSVLSEPCGRIRQFASSQTQAYQCRKGGRVKKIPFWQKEASAVSCTHQYVTSRSPLSWAAMQFNIRLQWKI